MAYSNVNAKDLVAKFQYALDNHWGYIWGAAGVMWTEAKQNATTDEQAIKYGKKWIGHTVADCSGLFAWAFKQLMSYMYHGSNTMWNKYCVKKGELKAGKRDDGEELKPGTAVFVYNKEKQNRSHVGLYVGNDTVIEAASTYSGVITSKITNKKWTEWGELKYVDFENGVTPTPAPESEAKTRLLRFGCKGDDVKELQELLSKAGYLADKIDGVFGKNTLAAVRNFQGSRGLAVDGIVGPKTLDALKKADAKVTYYRATITKLTETELKELQEHYYGRITSSVE